MLTERGPPQGRAPLPRGAAPKSGGSSRSSSPGGRDRSRRCPWRRAGPGPAAPAHEVPTAGVDPVLVRNLGILRRPLRASDQLPSAFKARPTGALLYRFAAGQMIPSMLGLLPRPARRATIPTTGVSV